MSFLEKLITPQGNESKPAKNCLQCWYSQYKGVTCYQTDPPTKILSKNQAAVCDYFTTTDPNSDLSNVESGIVEVDESTDLVAAAVGEVKTAVDTTKTAVDEGTTATELVQAAVETLQSKTDDVKTEVEGVQVAVASVDTNMQATKNAVDANKAEIVTLQGKQDTTNAGITTLQGKQDTTNSKLDLTKAAVEALKGASTKTLTDLDTELGGVQVAVASVEAGITTLQGKADTTNTKLDQNKTAIDLTKNAIDALKGAGSKTFSDVVSDLGTLQTNIDNVKTEVEGVQVAVASVQSMTEDVKDAVASVEAMVARPAWYDRNPASVVKHFANYATSPSATWTYTVPAGKKAMVELMTIWIQRDITASVAGRADVIINWVSGATYTPLVNAFIKTNGVGDRATKELGQTMFLFAGETIQADAGDSSTGGSCWAVASAKITEFDV